MTTSNAQPITYLEPWGSLEGNGSVFEAELAREIGPRHELYGRTMVALARREDCDDVLFVSVDDEPVIAVVHLTWKGRVEADTSWPRTTFYRSLNDWIDRGMKADHRDFAGKLCSLSH